MYNRRKQYTIKVTQIAEYSVSYGHMNHRLEQYGNYFTLLYDTKYEFLAKSNLTNEIVMFKREYYMYINDNTNANLDLIDNL